MHKVADFRFPIYRSYETDYYSLNHCNSIKLGFFLVMTRDGGDELGERQISWSGVVQRDWRSEWTTRGEIGGSIGMYDDRDEWVMAGRS